MVKGRAGVIEGTLWERRLTVGLPSNEGRVRVVEGRWRVAWWSNPNPRSWVATKEMKIPAVILGPYIAVCATSPSPIFSSATGHGGLPRGERGQSFSEDYLVELVG